MADEDPTHPGVEFPAAPVAGAGGMEVTEGAAEGGGVKKRNRRKFGMEVELANRIKVAKAAHKKCTDILEKELGQACNGSWMVVSATLGVPEGSWCAANGSKQLLGLYGPEPAPGKDRDPFDYVRALMFPCSLEQRIHAVSSHLAFLKQMQAYGDGNAGATQNGGAGGAAVGLAEVPGGGGADGGTDPEVEAYLALHDHDKTSEKSTGHEMRMAIRSLVQERVNAEQNAGKTKRARVFQCFTRPVWWPEGWKWDSAALNCTTRPELSVLYDDLLAWRRDAGQM